MNREDATLLLTRPRAAAERFADEVTARFGAIDEVIVSPVLEIAPIAADIPSEPSFFAFTSENGVLAAEGRISGWAWCVGSRTALAAKAAGLTLSGVSTTVDILASKILNCSDIPEVIHLSGKHQAGDLVAALRAGGQNARRIVIYDQIEQPLTVEASTALNSQKTIIAPVFSPRSARLFSGQIEGLQAELHLVALSQAVADAWDGPAPSSVTVAANPTAPAMLDAIASLI